MFADLGFQRVAAVQPELYLADPDRNAQSILEWARRADAESVTVAVFPELCLTGYTCEDLFHQSSLLSCARTALGKLARGTAELELAAVVGAPYQLPDGRVFNCAFVVHRGRVRAAVPKTFLPNYGEYYEHRWFASGRDVGVAVSDSVLGPFRLSAAQLFRAGALLFGIEICEDLWAPVPPSCARALAGANVIVNPSASDELVAKGDYRRELVRQQSARLLAGYVYTSSGPYESTKDVVFAGDCLVAENGTLLAEGTRCSFRSQMVTADLDIQKLQHERAHNVTFAAATAAAIPHDVHELGGLRRLSVLRRTYSRTPFVPGEPELLGARQKEILDIQSVGLARRIQASRSQVAVLGVSGGLDSTLALLVAIEAMRRLGRAPASVVGVSMPGLGTTERTQALARALASVLGISFREIPIRSSVMQHFADIGHDPASFDVVYENAQARERTQILFDLANDLQGLVVGTGDMSELALGFCTYNADHMAGYAVNVSVPKTLVRHLVDGYARRTPDEEIRSVLATVLEARSSPELLPLRPDGTTTQDTEMLIGPYELHDFFLFHHVRNGFGPRKILELAARTFDGAYARGEIERWLRVFIERFYRQQFKRTCLPPGPKVGSVSLSPRGDLRLPDEVDPAWLLAELDRPLLGDG